MKFTIICALLVTAFAARVARADHWDSKGWVKLGEREVNGKFDHDRIEVGKYEGKFNRLTIHVEDSDVELIDFEIVFGNNEKFHPEMHHFFKEGARESVIDLPGNGRLIQTINLKYKNVRGGHAKIEVWGFNTTETKEHDMARPAPFSWESKGWTMLGEREVNGKIDHDRIEVGRYEGQFHKLTLVVFDGDLEMLDFEIKFALGEPWHPELRHFFKEGTRTHVIDFPWGKRTIRYVDFKYANVSSEHARVQVWAK